MLNGLIHLPGDSIRISDIQYQSDDCSDPRSTLICVTTNINIACCRDYDNPNNIPNGGAVGNWYYPNGTTILNAKDETTVNLAKCNLKHQLRLGRVASALIPPGKYRCEVPNLVTGALDNAAITIQHG